MQNINMKWFLIVWISLAIIFDGLRYQKIVQQKEKINMMTNKSIIQYNRVTLYRLADKVRSDLRYKVFNHNTCNNIRKLKLTRRGCRGGIRKKSHLDIIHQTGSIKNNLIRINTEQQEVRSNYHSLCICLANIKSVKNKQLILHQYLVENKIAL